MKDKFNMATTHFIIVSDDIPSQKLEAMEQEIEDVDGITNVVAMNEFLGSAIPADMISMIFVISALKTVISL